MSFDLYIVDDDTIPDDDEVLDELLGDDAAWGSPLTPRLAACVAELESRFPGDMDDSPWASWPLEESVLHGRGCALNIVWPHAEAMSEHIRVASQRAGLSVYDPQSGQVHRPPNGASDANGPSA